MTNYIDEMIKTAGVREIYWSFESADGNTYTWELNEDGNEKHNMCFFGKPELKQRYFTAEKQLEIIKLIGKVKDFNCFFDENDKEWVFSAGLTLPVCFDIQESHKDFAQALAQLTTELLKAGELDKEKVKEILEG